MADVDSIDHQLQNAIAEREAARADEYRATLNIQSAERAKLRARQRITDGTRRIDGLLDDRRAAAIADRLVTS